MYVLHQNTSKDTRKGVGCDSTVSEDDASLSPHVGFHKTSYPVVSHFHMST